MVQDTAYQSLLKSTRQHCHRQVAELLEARFPETVDTDPELMAHHYTAAGCIEQAVTYWDKAGRRAVQRSANIEAARHLGTALELQNKLPNTRERKRNELALRMMLGPALINTKGPLSEEVQSNYARAQRLCTQLPESPMHFTALWGSWRITRNFVEKQRIADELLTLAKRLADQKLELQAHHTQWATLFHLGKHDGCLRHVAKGLYLYNPADYRTHASMYGGHDPKVCGCGEAAFSLWLLGKPDSSLERADDALAWARGLSHSGSLVHALDMNLLLHRYRRDAATVLVRAEELIDFAGREKFPVHEAKGLVFRGWALAQLGEPEQGIKLLRSGLASQKDVGTREDFPIFIDMLAEILGMTGRSEEGLRHIDHVLSETEASGLRFWTAELYRRMGHLLLERNEKSKAKKEFRRARTVAREQNAISLELRTAMSLVRLWAERGKAREAHDVLSSVYGKFTEGFDTTDLKEAAILLEATA